jgi:predicted membrane protein
MTNINNNNEELLKRHRNGKRLAGFIVVIVGAVLLCKQSGAYIPDWVLSWPMFLIALGLFVGAKHQFRNPGWIILCLIGAVFLADQFIEGFTIAKFFWPVMIIVAGLYMILGPKRKRWRNEYWKKAMENRNEYETYNREDYIDSVGIFSGIKKTVFSKDFKGGDVVCVFGGAEINLSQAEIKGHVVMEVVNVFGGTKLIVPANWEIRSEMVAILGGIEDKRFQQENTTNGVDVLVIRGTSIFGGIEIKSY